MRAVRPAGRRGGTGLRAAVQRWCPWKWHAAMGGMMAALVCFPGPVYKVRVREQLKREFTGVFGGGMLGQCLF